MTDGGDVGQVEQLRLEWVALERAASHAQFRYLEARERLLKQVEEEE